MTAPDHSTPTRDEERFEDALSRLVDVGDTLHPTRRAATLKTGDLFRDTLALAVSPLGVQLHLPAEDTPALDPFQRLAAYGRVSGFRFRAVTLRQRWWTHAGPPMLARLQDGGDLIALVPDTAGYLAKVPGQPDRRLGGALAKTLSTQAFQLYDTLPETIGPRDFLWLAFRGAGVDFRRVMWVALGAAALSLVVPIVFGSIIATAIPEGRTSLLMQLTLMLVAATIANALLETYKDFAIARLTGRADLRLQAALWDRVLSLKSVFFRDWTTGDLAQRLLGVDGIRRILSSTLLGGILSGVFGIVNLVVMSAVGGSLALWGLGYAVAAGAVFALLTAAQIHLQRISYDLRGRIQSLIVQLLAAIPKVRVAGAERRAFARWADLYARQRGTDARSAVLSAGSVTLQMTILPLGSFMLFVLIGAGDRLTTAEFVAFNTALVQLLASTLGLFSSVAGSLKVVPLWERLQPILRAPVEPTAGREDPGPLDGSLSLRSLTFRYTPSGPAVLEDLSFDVAPGQFVGIVGHSGSGKSTVFRLLLGLDEPERGTILYGGKDLAHLDVRRVRQQIGTVLQETGLVPGSIYETIAGPRSYSEEQVTEALTMAGLADDIAQMPMGLKTMVSEGGSTFSGGQRQRLMIARALIARPKLLLFDEATSALDNFTQKIVTQSLRDLAATRIVIAHRLSTIVDADVILVLDGGKIVERGTYDELIAKKGLFRDLVQRQIA
ncbi:NHLP bacteriocin export ABC transporter permease/ATPase subunit [Xanthobacteraceae bacterium A53D]